MPIDIQTTQSPTIKSTAYRSHAPHLHLQSVFGDDWFALKAEAFARFLGTPSFSSLRPSLLLFGFLSMSLDLQRSTSIRLSSSTSPSAGKQHMRLHSSCWRRPKPTATRLVPSQTRNIVRLCTPRARNGRRLPRTLLVEMLRQNTQVTEAVKARSADADVHKTMAASCSVTGRNVPWASRKLAADLRPAAGLASRTEHAEDLYCITRRSSPVRTGTFIYFWGAAQARSAAVPCRGQRRRTWCVSTPTDARNQKGKRPGRPIGRLLSQRFGILRESE